MALGIPLQKANTRQKRFSFLGPEICSNISTSIKHLKTLSFLCMLLRKLFYFICKHKLIQIITTFLLIDIII